MSLSLLRALQNYSHQKSSSWKLNWNFCSCFYYMSSRSVQKSFYTVFPTRFNIAIIFNGYKIPRLDLLPVHAPMNVSLLYFAISIGFQWNIALYTKFFFWLLSVFMDLLQIILQTWFKNTNLLATYDHLPRSNLFHYQFLPVHMDNGLFVMLHPNSGIIYHIMLKTLRLLVNLSLLWKHIALAFWDEWCCWC